MPTSAKAMYFGSGGFGLASFALFSWVMLELPFYRVAISLALMMTLFYLAVDVATCLKTRRARMDFSIMHVISPTWESVTAVALIGLQCFAFYLC